MFFRVAGWTALLTFAMLDDLRDLLVGGWSFSALLLIFLAYVLFKPDEARSFAGLVLSVGARVFGGLDRAAVAASVEGAVNRAAGEMLANAPHLLEGKLKIEWTTAEAAESFVRSGEVVVFLRKSPYKEENIAHATMAYLPKAVLPRARRYFEPVRIRAIDLTLAKSVLLSKELAPGALDVFFSHYLDPETQQNPALRTSVTQLDEIDLSGWLTRVLLFEFRRISDDVYPREPERALADEAERFTEWLYRVASRGPYERVDLTFRGRYFRTSTILVALKGKLNQEEDVRLAVELPAVL